LLAQYLPEFHERPSSIRWRSMQGRWGSCTTVDRTIRIAERLASAPEYVLECVILHELIHLRLPGHGNDFHALLERYPDLARAESYLEGFEAGLGAPPEIVTTQELPAR
jgi:predicted metal-dependent hydrolase